jgi:hypothetical protein
MNGDPEWNSFLGASWHTPYGRGAGIALASILGEPLGIKLYI